MKKILSIVVAVVVILAGALFLYTKRLSPEQRLQAGFVNLINAANGHLQAKVIIETDPSASATLTEFKIDTDGNFQKKNDGQLEFDSSIIIKGSMTGATVTGKGAVRLVEGKLFYKLDEMPVALADITSIRGKWLPGATNINFLADPARSNLILAFQKPQLFTSIKEIGKEKIEGINTTHFQTTFSASGYASFVEEFSKLSGGSAPVSKTDLENGVKALNNVPFDLWLDSGNKLRKVTVSYVNPQNKAKVSIELLLTSFVGKDKIVQPAQSEQAAVAPAAPLASIAPVSSPAVTPATK